MQSFLPTFLIIALFILSCNTRPTEKPVVLTDEALLADSAMAVTAHPLASLVGLDILKKGGNAVDAAIAVQFALAVVHPSAGNIGGGGFIVYREADGDAYTLDFREKAPLAAYKTMYQDSAGNVIENLSRRGHLASGVPGTVAGMVSAHERFGSLPWNILIQPAIDLALDGFVLTEREANGLNSNLDEFIAHSTMKPEFLIKESGWEAGDTIYWKDLGETLERIRDNKRAGFYAGKTADDIVKEMQRGGGLITYEDLEKYEAIWREPVTGKYKEYAVISMAPPSSGGVALLQLLKIIEDLPISDYGFHSTEAIHTIVEAEKRVYADRAKYLGDPDFIHVPVSQLIDEEYLNERMVSFNEDQATKSEDIAAGELFLEHEQTTHFSIVDKYGNAVSLTTTLNGSYGSKVIVAGSGFLLNNEMDDFSAKPGYPNMFGLIGGEANKIEPEKRMLSSMTPTILEKDGKLFMVVGTPGGSTIITSVFQVILNVVEYDMNMQQAVAAKRYHHQWLPDKIFYEEGAIPSEVKEELIEMGHILQTRGAIGRVDAILVKNGQLQGGADPRGDDTAMGF
ncbi:MAG: gamma-glutamyltransferase [Candidatus Cyclobacteriaceae bacterium M2_1C_046]